MSIKNNDIEIVQKEYIVNKGQCKNRQQVDDAKTGKMSCQLKSKNRQLRSDKRKCTVKTDTLKHW